MYSIVQFVPRIHAEEAKRGGRPIRFDESGMPPELFTPKMIEDQGSTGSYVMTGTAKGRYGSWQGEFKVYADAKRGICTIERVNDDPIAPFAARGKIHP